MYPQIDPLTGMVTLVKRENRVAVGGGKGIATGSSIGTSNPASGTNGQLFYNTTNSTLYVWANGSWNAISGGGTPPTNYFLQMETGDYLLTETGDKIILE